MLEGLLGAVGRVFHQRPWYRLPTLLGLPALIDIRNRMRKENLHDTEEPPLPVNPGAQNVAGRLREARTIDGTYNDLSHPTMGAVGARFGRNFPLPFTFPDRENLLHPNPRVVSRELMTRREFQPATIINLLAAAWIQFMVHDWFAHRRSRLADGLDIPLPEADDWPGRQLRVPRTVAEPPPPGSVRPPAYANINSHWWDASQVYGSDVRRAASLRSGTDGKLLVDGRRLPLDPDTGIDRTGFNDNWWLGLSLLHTLFALEHNHVCDRLRGEYPRWSDEQLYDKARLIIAAATAKIHTVEWTPAIVPQPTAAEALRINWRGVIGEDLQEIFHFLNNSEVLGGIVGSPTDHHAAPFSLTEEFVAVYRMHPLLPDHLTIRSASSHAMQQQYAFPEFSGRNVRAIVDRFSWDDLFYSFGTTHPGAVRLHNYPRHLQYLQRTNEHGEAEELDLAAVDILRDRERGVPRYNQFRRLLGKNPVHSFNELTDNAEWREEIRRVYHNDLEKVDLMTGLYAEPLPEGFGFSETAFRIFILMASRRLKSDRFFTADFRPEVYTPCGYEYLREIGLSDILRRHAPGVTAALDGVENPFAPWKAAEGPV